jgi:protein TonB
VRSATIFGSLIVHALVAFVLVRAAKVRARRPPIPIAVVSAKKKAMESKPPPPKKKAAPLPAAPVNQSHAAGAQAHAPATPIETDVQMSNVPDDNDPGLPVLPPKAREIAAATPEPPKLLARARKQETPAEHGAAAEDCSEEPTKPVVLARPSDIEYTQKARTDGVEGRLVLQVIVAADGSVSDVKVVKGVEPGLDAAAVAAVQTWRFKPALRCGKPVGGGVYTIAQRFELGD